MRMSGFRERKGSLFEYIINPLLTQLVQSGWLYIGLVLSLVLIDLVELDQYPAILTSRLVNNLYLLKLLLMVHRKYSIIPKTKVLHKCPV